MQSPHGILHLAGVEVPITALERGVLSYAIRRAHLALQQAVSTTVTCLHPTW